MSAYKHNSDVEVVKNMVRAWYLYPAQEVCGDDMAQVVHVSPYQLVLLIGPDPDVSQIMDGIRPVTQWDTVEWTGAGSHVYLNIINNDARRMLAGRGIDAPLYEVPAGTRGGWQCVAIAVFIAVYAAASLISLA